MNVCNVRGNFLHDYSYIVASYAIWCHLFGKSFEHVYRPYRNDPKFSDRYAWANSADPDQTAPDQGLHFAIPSASFGLITLWYSHIVQILGWENIRVCIC